MKYRVRADMSFDSEEDALKLMESAQVIMGKASIINAGLPNEEGSYCRLEYCGHDEGKPCIEISKTELKTSP